MIKIPLSLSLHLSEDEARNFPLVSIMRRKKGKLFAFLLHRTHEFSIKLLKPLCHSWDLIFFLSQFRWSLCYHCSVAYQTHKHSLALFFSLSRSQLGAIFSSFSVSFVWSVNPFTVARTLHLHTNIWKTKTKLLFWSYYCIKRV